MKSLKKSFVPLAIFSLLILSGVIQGYAQESLTPAQWRSDLAHFKNLIHSKYAHFFTRLPAKRFDSAVAAMDAKIPHLNETQIKVEFAKLVALFQVGHTQLRLRSGTDQHLIPWVQKLPVEFYLFSDGLFIKSIDERYIEALGGQVIKIGQLKTDAAMEKIRPAIAYENEQGYKSLLPHFLNIPEFLYATGITRDKGPVTIIYRKDGMEKTITLKPEELKVNLHNASSGIRIPNGWTDVYDQYGKPGSVLWLKEPSRLRYFEYLPSTKTVYVRHSAVQDEPNETIAHFFEKVFRFIDSNDVDRFVLDIRLNGGGNNYLNKPVITGIIQSRKINRRGHLYIITGRATFSAAQNLTNELEKYTEAIFVGEPTSENVNFFGDTRTEVLPNSHLNINLSWLWWQNLDPRDKRPWTAPQLATDLSFEDYKRGIDPAMEAIMNYKAEANIEHRLRELVTAGQFDEAVLVASQYLKNPLHRYFKGELERKINDYGYNLMSNNQFKEANKVLQMNVKLFPESANVYDSYAESWWKLGNKEEAIRYYKTAISLDPHGVTGENAKKMLLEVQGNNEKKGF